MRLGAIKTHSVDPYYNLALERYLLENVARDQVILYLWQNQNTVVIGRNQSALSECRIQKLKEDGGHLARRLSGGGAVFHDLGNVNFTFLAPSSLFDEEKQTDVVLEAVRSLGIEAKKTGRNDLLCQGSKFSGHAYYHSKGRSYHHGTLLVKVDFEKMAAYLNPSPLKLASKGVSSVKSRVCNLCDHASALSVDKVMQAMLQAFEAVYKGTVCTVDLSVQAKQAIEAYRKQFSSSFWLLRDEKPLEHSVESRFSWGVIRIDWSEKLGMFDEVALFSDGLDPDFLNAISCTLQGCSCEKSSVLQALSTLIVPTQASGVEEKAQCASDIVHMIYEKRL